MEIGYLGPEGSFTHSAAKLLFESQQLIPCQTILSCLRSIEKEDFDFVVVPIENATEGTVNQTLDVVYHHLDVPIQGEVILPISQNLMVHPQWKNKWQSITEVKSHPQALAQTQQFLEDTLPKARQTVTSSTTEAAKWLNDHPEEKVGAIASVEAAATYGLEIVCPNIQDIPTNETRFWVIGKKALEIGQHPLITARKSIGVYFPENKPGNLHKVLSVFSWRELDLTKIESRPLRTHLGDYFFLIDIKNDQPDLVSLALEEIKSLGGIIKVLGDYPVMRKSALD